MKVYVIHPGASFATHDVYVGVVAGLRAQGVDVYEGRLDHVFAWYEAAWQAGLAAGVFTTPPPSYTEHSWAQRYCSAHITQDILWEWPDLVLAVSGGNYHLKDVAALRRVGIKTAVLLTESPYFMDVECLIARDYDTAFTHERAGIDLLRSAQPHTHYLPHAYHPQIHSPHIPADPRKACDVVFIGSVFEERRTLLTGVDWTGIDRIVRGYDLVAEQRDLVSNIDAAQHYRSAKISLNHHRTTTSHGSHQHITTGEAESLNPRAYEIAACGGFQLMDDSRPERFDVFGDLAPTYRAGDSADLERQIRHWLARDTAREQIAAAMHQAVAPHSWTQRAAQMLEVLR